jgi:hypothetical protein
MKSTTVPQKMKYKLFPIFAVGLLSTPASQAAVIFSQDFNSSSTVVDYVSATPNSSQYNAIGASGAGTTLGITSGALTFSRTTNVGSFSRTTDFSPAPQAITYQFDLTMSGNSAPQTTAAVFQVGSGFGTTNSAETNATTYARFGINIGATAGEFGIRDVTNGTSSSSLFSGTQSIFWVLNNSGSSMNYTAPNAVSTSIANDVADLWVGTTKVLNGVAIQTGAQTMTDLKFAFTSGEGTIAIDNIVINAIPEPAAAVLGGLGILTLLRRRR